MKIKTLTMLIVCCSSNAYAFTQWGGSGLTPMGHEWLTRASALELLNSEDLIKPDPEDPRLYWTQGHAKNLDLEMASNEVSKIKSLKKSDKLYEPKYDAVFSAIVGERWVDIAGFNVIDGFIGQYGPDCFDATAQEPADLQQDHFMRRYDDIGSLGGVSAAKRAQNRFIAHFVNAAMANEKRILVWDGGASSSKQSEVDYNYFLFGRAVHLFQDSFSLEHTVRLPKDNYKKIRQVKGYICSDGSEQHSHSSFTSSDFYDSNDVIWKKKSKSDTGWQSYKPSNMKPAALTALEASKDLWAAFIRTMATSINERETIARKEAQQLIDTWLSFDEEEMLSWYDNETNRDDTFVTSDNKKGQSQKTCLSNISFKNSDGSKPTPTTIEELASNIEKSRNKCLFNIEPVPGFADLYDPYIKIPYNWKWKSNSWKTPSQDWAPSSPKPDNGEIINILAYDNNQLSADIIANNSKIITSGKKGLDFIKVPSENNGYYFRLNNYPNLFFSYSASSDGTAKLINSPKQSEFILIGSKNTYNIKNTYWDQFVWYNKTKNSVHLTSHGNEKNIDSSWTILNKDINN
ncbi:TPA: hemolysin D [Photobacterium damselae]